MEAVADPSQVNLVRAILELVEKCLIVDEDPSGKLLQAVLSRSWFQKIGCDDTGKSEEL